MSNQIKIGVSSCLLGEAVRYDGGHKHDHYITDVLGRYFVFVPVCPETGCGLPVPREAMRLEGDSEAPRLVARITKRDLTEQMTSYCDREVVELEKEGLCGFIFKKDSPSSGLFRVKVYNNNIAVKNGTGLFAKAFKEHFPILPLEEEGRLNDHVLRENFIERVFSFSRWKEFRNNSPSPHGLVEFHTAHKLMLMAHSPSIYRDLGKIVALSGSTDFTLLLSRYEELFMKGLSTVATAKKHTNVLQHIMGYFKNLLSSDEKCEILEIIQLYHDHTLPLIVPLTLLKHYIRKYQISYLSGQVYLSPHPDELMLRNHV